LRVRQLSIYSQNHTDNVYNHRTNAHRNAAGLPLTETGLKENPPNHHNMTKDDFFNLLTEEVKTYKNFLETANNEWIVKGFIDVDKNI
jgi:hypothetical protein